jgi:hypothetical protein
MLPFVTTSAQGNQVVRHISAKVVPWLHVMNLQVFHGAALLAPPTISF